MHEPLGAVETLRDGAAGAVYQPAGYCAVVVGLLCLPAGSFLRVFTGQVSIGY